MKRFAILLSAASVFSALGLAETYSGTLVDIMCKGKDLASHTKKCAIGCAKSGFALVTADGKMLKLDENGNAKALAALKATAKESDLKAKVSGTEDGDTLKATAVDIQ